jgi:hypothetical protein
MAFALTKNTNYLDGVSGNGNTVAVYDSGSIVTIPQPGQSTSPKLFDGTQQSATTQACDSTIAGGGNFITKAQVATYGPAGASLGYSILGE